MQTTVRKWGNSLGLRIPKSFAVEIGITENTPVDLLLVDGTLVVSPLIQTPYVLDELLSQITDENMHGEVETGDPVGIEVW